MITAEEYIARFVDAAEEPAGEYINGALLPKPLGTRKHSQVQANLTKLIGIRETQYDVPDLAIEGLARPI